MTNRTCASRSASGWRSRGFETETYPSAEEALKGIGADFPGVVITDVKMPGMDGVTFLKRLMAQDSGLPVIMITGHGDVPMAVDAMRIGAFDFLEKPFNPDKMTELAKKASQQRRMTLDNRALRRELADGKAVMKKLIGSSPEMERLREDILDLGQADSHVLIDGETGTGKTLVAHALHAVGPRATKKFITLSCSAWAEQQLSEKLFGPDPGDALPLVEEARGGTLCLEDIEALPNAIQARLLTFINEQETPPQTRIIAICNEHTAGKTLEDSLRPDLFFRLSAMTIICPPLRARGEDILTLFKPHVRDLRRGIRLRRAAGHRAGGRAASAGAMAGQRAAAGQHRRARGLAEPARVGLDHVASDGRQRGDGADHLDRGQAAQGIRGSLRADAHRQHDAPPQGIDLGGDGRAVPAAADPEREDGEIRVEPGGLPLSPLPFSPRRTAGQTRVFPAGKRAFSAP